MRIRSRPEYMATKRYTPGRANYGYWRLASHTKQGRKTTPLLVNSNNEHKDECFSPDQFGINTVAKPLKLNFKDRLRTIYSITAARPEG
jgi:hypothetical protein